MRQAAEYGAARLAVAGLGRLPVGAADRLGAALGRAAHRLGWRRSVVEAQLAAAFPGRDPDWRSATARACYEHMGREAVTIAALARGGRDAVRRAVEAFDGLDELRAALADGRGAVIVTGHFGNWELAGSALPALDLEMDAVVQGIRNPYLDRYVCRLRRDSGIGLIDRSSAWSRLIDSLRARRIVAFAADQDARSQGVFVPFFGRPASTHRAPALLALRAGAPLFVGTAPRVGPRRYRIGTSRVEPPAAGPLRDRVRELTCRWTEELERRIRLSPEQYFWHHRRWKTRPPGTAPVDVR